MNREEVEKNRLINLIAVQDELRKREGYTDPSTFGLPDLLFPMGTLPAELEKLDNGLFRKRKRKLLAQPEKPTQYRLRRYQELKKFLESSVHIQKDGRIEELKIVEPVLEFLGDIFFGYVRRAILWKNRGGGGSLAAAIVMWLRMVWHNQSWMDMAGCLLPNTEVLVKELKNHIPVRCVQEGMHVWTLTEGWRKITKVYKRSGEYTAYHIKPYLAKEVNTFTEDHLIAVVTGLERDYLDYVENPDVEMWDNLEVTWKEARFVNPETDLVVMGRPSNIMQAEKPSDVCVKKNGRWYGKERVYSTIEDMSSFAYVGDVFDLSVDSEPYFMCHGMTCHNSQEQAKQVYLYTTQFWDCFPLMKKHLLPKDTQVSMTKLATGVTLSCVTSTEKAVRSKHPPGLCMDEVCQDKEGIDTVFRSAMGASLTEPNSTIIALSTFHIPIGLFQDLWDNASTYGFRRYTWSTWDIMERCSEGLEYATNKDPNAYKFCLKQCPLSEQIHEMVHAPGGMVSRKKYIGCCGKARHTSGFRKRHVVISAKAASGKNFLVEWENERPVVPGSVYDINDIIYAEKDDFELPENESPIFVHIGIDWGFNEGCMCVVLLYEKGVYIPEAEFMNFKTVTECIEQLIAWRDFYANYDEEKDAYPNFCVYADSSHPFNNDELIQNGFETIPVEFGSVKQYGISNISKFLENGRVYINADGNNMYKFLRQVKEYRNNKKTGKPIKKNDHAPDSFLAAMIELDYDELFGPDSNIKDLVAGITVNKPQDDNSVLIF
jgi:hypothetical protein